MHVELDDYIHYQWTGCDTNPTNLAGGGTDQTDRSNIVQIESSNHNYPASDQWLQNNDPLFPTSNDRKRMGYLDQTGCLTLAELQQKVKQKTLVKC